MDYPLGDVQQSANTERDCINLNSSDGGNHFYDRGEIVNETQTNSTNGRGISSGEMASDNALPNRGSHIDDDIFQGVRVNEESNHHSGNSVDPEPSVHPSEEDTVNEKTLLVDSFNSRVGHLDHAGNRRSSDVETRLDIPVNSDDQRNMGMERLDKESKSKTIANQTEAEWLKSILPEKMEGSGAGYWAVKNSGAGFDVDFRVGKPKLNLSFPYVSREVFTTWKGLTNEQARRKAAIYVRGHLQDAVASGNDKARIVAGKLPNLA